MQHVLPIRRFANPAVFVFAFILRVHAVALYAADGCCPTQSCAGLLFFVVYSGRTSIIMFHVFKMCHTDVEVCAAKG